MTYTKAQAIAWLSKVGKDKTTTMFSSLGPAMLNVLVGNDGSCVSATIAAANAWMTTDPVGSGVPASSAAWSLGEPLHATLVNYNNVRLCAPHRNETARTRWPRWGHRVYTASREQAAWTKLAHEAHVRERKLACHP